MKHVNVIDILQILITYYCVTQITLKVKCIFGYWDTTIIVQCS